MQTYPFVLDDPLVQEAFRGYTIFFVAPSSGIHADTFQRLQMIKQLPINFSYTALHNEISYHSHNDLMRFTQLKEALFDTTKPAIIWVLRGGYGSARLIEALNELPKPPGEKVFIGFSDTTALHLFFSQKWQWSCLHACGLSQVLDPKQDPKNYIKIAEIISKTVNHASIDDLKPLNEMALNSASVCGPLTGGNLTLVENSIGTSWQIQTEDKILFLEEIGEKGYRIDRSLNHLYQAGLLRKVRAIVLGQFLHETDKQEIAFALERFAKDFSIPIYKSNQFGHGNCNYPLIYNSKAEIRVREESDRFGLFMQIF